MARKSLLNEAMRTPKKQKRIIVRGTMVEPQTVITKKELKEISRYLPQHPRSPKYRYVEPPADREPAFTAKDIKDLARLVWKFGPDRIALEAHRIEPRGPGRPSAEADIDVAYCIEQWTEEYREEGVRDAFKRAQLDLYELLHSPEEQSRIATRYVRQSKIAKASGRKPPRSHFERWWENSYKRKFLRGRQLLRLQQEQARRRQEYLNRRKGR